MLRVNETNYATEAYNCNALQNSLFQEANYMLV
jgi:hypothetical protein